MEKSKNIGILELEGMEFRAHHGCLERERIAGNDFVVDFRGEMDMSAAAESDRLEDAVNYALIYDVIAEEMAVPSNLLEHMAGRIIKALAARFPEFGEFSVRVSKKRPPVNGIVQWSRITLHHHRKSRW
jgi:dihydroneopterin aldolase